MNRVLLADDAPGLGHMLADLMRQNLETQPERAKVLDATRGRVNVRATDADVEVGLVFTGGVVSVGSALAEPDLAIACDSASLLELSACRFRRGLPDPTTREGRALLGKLARGALRIDGMVVHRKLLRQVQELLSVR